MDLDRVELGKFVEKKREELGKSKYRTYKDAGVVQSTYEKLIKGEKMRLDLACEIIEQVTEMEPFAVLSRFNTQTY